MDQQKTVGYPSDRIYDAGFDSPRAAQRKGEDMSRIATLSVVSLLAAATVVGKPVAAAAPVAGYTGQVQSSVADCPYILWRLARHDNGDVTGIVYYSDMTGVSEAKGTVDQAGHFQITLTSSMGQGPVGTITGTKSPNGATTATMTGQGCANAKLKFNPVANLRLYNPTGANQ